MSDLSNFQHSLQIFDQPFDFNQFVKFVDMIMPAERTLFASPQGYVDLEVPNGYEQFVKSMFLIRDFKDKNGYELHVLTVELKRQSSVERSRVSQRNLIAKYLKERDLDGALVAFYTEEENFWRLSLVVRSFSLQEMKEKFSEPRRYSFIVGKSEQNYTVKRQFLHLFDKLAKGEELTFDMLKEVFSVEAVSEDFYKELLGKHLIKIRDYVQERYEVELTQAEDISTYLFFS